MTTPQPTNPLIVQGDHTILVDLASPRYPEARDRLGRFAELVKAPEHIHTYRVSALSVWNACAAGEPVSEMLDTLQELAKFAVPANVLSQVRDFASRYGRVQLTRDDEGLVLTVDSPVLAAELTHQRNVAPLLGAADGPNAFRIEPRLRGEIKQALIKAGFPAEDLAGYTPGEPLPMALRETTLGGRPFSLRHYQEDAATAFHQSGSNRGGAGVIVLPCGAGKTVVAMACMAKLEVSTLILATSVTAAQQWRRELLDKTTLRDKDVAEYTGDSKDIQAVTIATYQILTWRRKRDGDFPHLKIFEEKNWGLIIYDEVHLLPAPIFRATASLQPRRRLGLSATLVREDGREDDVFALIGPKKADVPWKVLEQQGWIATADCTEIRLALPKEQEMEYALAGDREKFRIAAENPDKLEVVRYILNLHPQEPTLIIGLYLNQLQALAEPLGVPVLTGQTPQRKRDALYAAFTSGEIRVLVVSKVANFAVDLPDAAVAIQVSGTFGSRQEEAQRLGRILRPKSGENQAHFYTVVTRDTVEQDFALHRQLFLAEQGYQYRILDREELADA